MLCFSYVLLALRRHLAGILILTTSLFYSTYWLFQTEDAVYVLLAEFIWVGFTVTYFFLFNKISGSTLFYSNWSFFPLFIFSVLIYQTLLDHLLLFPWLGMSNLLSAFPIFHSSISAFGNTGFTIYILLLLASIADIVQTRKKYGILFLSALLSVLFFVRPEHKAFRSLNLFMGAPDINNHSASEKFSEIISVIELGKAADSPVDLFVFPEIFLESGITHQFANKNIKLAKLRHLVQQSAFLSGCHYNALTVTTDTLTYNAALLFNASQSLQVSNKKRYIPVSEKDIPYLSDRSDTYNGTPGENIFIDQFVILDSITVLPILCFDSSFKISSSADLIAILCEEQFFKGSFGQYLYFYHSVARALEAKKTLIRQSNGGWCGIIYPNGNIKQITQPKLCRIDLFNR